MKNKKVVYTIIGFISIALVALAITYAYWQITKNQEGVNEISSACLDISLVDAESGNTGIALQDQFPLSDTEGAVLKPYKFTVTNNCNVSIDYQIALESTGDSSTALKSSSIKVMLDDNTTLLNSNERLTSTVSGAYASHKLGMGTLTKSGDTGSSITHELRLWIDEDAPVSENNKTYTGKITVTIGQGIETSVIKEGSLAYTLLNAYGGESAITELNSEAFATATTASDAGMYKATDDYGISYYYRGNVTNNYVKFGAYPEEITQYILYYGDECDSDGSCTTFELRGIFDNIDNCDTYASNIGSADYKCEKNIVAAGSPIYWRIVRINGDGTIRLIYDGSQKFDNGTNEFDMVAFSSYASEFGVTSPGYMYGTEEDPYGDNDDTVLTSSLVKGVVDSWYTSYLKANYEDYIADSIFCNNREVLSGEGDEIVFKNDERIKNNTPVLTCSNKRDSFTVDDTTLGNGHLTNPIGLLTADELVFAGYSYRATSENNYIYSSLGFMTATPSNNLDSIGENFVIYQNILTTHWRDYDLGVRPVINLKSDVAFTIDEDGTYVITTN